MEMRSPETKLSPELLRRAKIGTMSGDDVVRMINGGVNMLQRWRYGRIR